MKSLAFLPVVIGIVWTSAAGAERVTYQGVDFELSVPKGYCSASRDHARDRVMLEDQDGVQAGTNVVLLMVAPCAELEEYRAGKRERFSEHGLWLLQLHDGKPILLPKGASREKVMKEFASLFQRAETAAIATDTTGKLKPAGMPASVQAVGMIDQDANGIYIGVRSTIVPSGPDTAAVALMSTIGRYPVSFQLYRSLVGVETYQALIADVRETVGTSLLFSDIPSTSAEAYLDDGELFGWLNWRRIIEKGAKGAITGAAIALIVGVWFAISRFYKKRPNADSTSASREGLVEHRVLEVSQQVERPTKDDPKIPFGRIINATIWLWLWLSNALVSPNVFLDDFWGAKVEQLFQLNDHIHQPGFMLGLGVIPISAWLIIDWGLRRIAKRRRETLAKNALETPDTFGNALNDVDQLNRPIDESPPTEPVANDEALREITQKPTQVTGPLRRAFNVFRRQPVGADGRQYARTLYARIGRFVFLTAFWIVISGAGIGATVAGYQYVAFDRHKNNIELRVRKSAELCSDPERIHVRVLNDSDKTIQKISFRLEARIPSRSTNHASFRYLTDDHIIAPGESVALCWKMPLLSSLDPDVDRDALIWRVGDFDVTFE